MDLEFTNPEMIWFLLGLPVLVITHFLTLKLKKSVALKFSNFDLLIRSAPSKAISQAYGGALMGKDISILVLRFLTLAMLIFAVAGTSVIYFGKTTDVDYVLGIDLSNSMNAQDLLPSRLFAAKDAAKKFVDTVPFLTKTGLITFAGTTRIEQGLTDEKRFVKDKIDALSASALGGTDLGGAIIAGSNVLTKGERNKAIILFTDGQSNIGIPLLDAISLAKKEGVTIHTIGIGSREGGLIPGLSNISFQLDETMLKSIADNSGGKYFRATNKQTLKEAYEAIAIAKIGIVRLKLSPYLLLIALILLFAEWGIVNIKYRTVP